MKLILSEDVPKLGDAGDVVQVKPGYARNYLLPRDLAIIATESRVKELEHHKRMIAEKRQRELKDVRGFADRITAAELSVTVQAGEAGKLFGSVTAQNIVDLLAEQGLPVDRRKVVLHEPIRQLGEHQIQVRLRSDVSATIKLQVVSSKPVVAVAAASEDDEGEKIRFGGAEEDDHFEDD